MRQVRFHAFGGPEVPQVEDVPVPQPAGDLHHRRQAELSAWAATGRLRVLTSTPFGLGQAADAHRLVLARANSGKVLIDPSR